MNYEIRPYWNLDLAVIFKLGNVSDISLVGLAYEGIQTVTGAPTATPGKWLPAAQVQNIIDGTWYENTGTTASPVWSLVPSTGSGITELNGDVLAGPGTGTQTATVVGFGGVALSGPATVDASFYVYDTSVFNPVTLSKDVTMDNAGLVTVVGFQGTTIIAGPYTIGTMLYFDGTFWQLLLPGTPGQVLTMGASIPGWV